MTTSIPLYTEDDVRGLLTIATVMAELHTTLQHEAAGAAHNIAKTMAGWSPSSSAHALGALDTDAGLVGFKTWVNTPSGAAAQLTLFNSSNGTLLASMAAGHLGRFRTAAISGLATRWLSDPDADELAIIGTGVQALGQVEAVQLVRPLRRVRVWGPDADRKAAFAATIQDTLGLDAVAADSLEDAVAGAPIVTLITRASEPFLTVDMLAPHAHLNAVGAILPANAEFDAELLKHAALVVVDSVDNAKAGSRELREFYGEDWSSVHTLGEVITGNITRPDEPGLTIFKAMGMGLSDLASARAFLRLVNRVPDPAHA